MATTEEKWAALANALMALAAALSPSAEVAKAAEPAPKPAPKPAKVAAVPAAKAEEPKAEPAKAAAALPEGDLATQARKAAKSYAEVYGREGLKEQLKKFTEGTLADIPAEKLADFIAAVS